MKGQRPLFEKSLAKTFRLWILLLEKHMFTTRNLFQKGFPVMMQQQACHSNGLTNFKCSSCDIDEYIMAPASES